MNKLLEELRDAAEACTPSPLKDLLTRAADAVEVKQEPVELECYDAGFLSDFGGGNIGWWHDYIRAELDRAHDFYASQLENAHPSPIPDGMMPDVYKLASIIRARILMLPHYSFLKDANGAVRKSQGGAWIDRHDAAALLEIEHVDEMLKAAGESYDNAK